MCYCGLKVKGFMMGKRAQQGKSAEPRETKAESYRYPEAESTLRPEAGTQAQFKKKKPPVTYRYFSSLSPALEWDGQNGARVGRMAAGVHQGRVEARIALSSPE
jgi:hypothetical protein